MRKFTALYTHQKTKKAKSWQDGFAHYNSDTNDITVYDSSKQRIANYRLRAKEIIELSNEYDIGRFLLTLEEEEGETPAASSSISQQTSAISSLTRPAAKRAKRIPSLIKPIKLATREPEPETEPATGSAAQPPSDNNAPTKPIPKTTKTAPNKSFRTKGAESVAAAVSENPVEYIILYTTQKIKKIKAWADGILLFYESDSRITLKSEDGGTLTNTHFPRSKSIQIGGEVDIGMYLVQVEGLHGVEDAAVSKPSAAPLQGALKRRYAAVQEGATLRSPLAGLKRTALPSVKLQKMTSHLADHPMAAAAKVVAAELAPVATSDIEQSRAVSTPKKMLSINTGRAVFVPPTLQAPRYLHFPRRGELLQHVSVSKGYNLGPARQLTVPFEYAEWTQYRDAFSALLRENLMAELSALAIRYFFMAREKHDGTKTRAETSSNTRISKRGKGSDGTREFRGNTGGFAQVCKGVGVTYFDSCTLRQPFLDGAAFYAQRSAGGSVRFHKGDSVTLELSRRENYVGYARDDTWAISTSADFPTATTFLARSVFFGPSKNNTLELMLIGEEDAQAALRVFGGAGAGRGERTTSDIVAIRCLDSGSDWAMLDAVEERLCPETLPLLPHLLCSALENNQLSDAEAEAAPAANVAEADADSEEVLRRVRDILEEKKHEFKLNNEQQAVLEQSVMSAVSIYVPVAEAKPVTIVHGPFGTGKSFLVAALAITLDTIVGEFPAVFGHGSSADQHVDRVQAHNIDLSLSPRLPPLRILVASMTNFAVDNMLSALLKQGYDTFLRVGNLKRISKRILPYVCRTSASATDDAKELEAMLDTATGPDGDDDERDAIATALQRVRQQNAQDALEAAFVVGTTCLSAGAAALRGLAFPVVVLDEACQIVEPMALIALASASCRRLVLVGDPLQLPPTLTTRCSREADGHGLERALFSRLAQLGHSPRMLATQFRCHPRIATLCSALFYGGRLRHGVTAGERPALIPGMPPLALLDVPGKEKQQGRSQSFFNRSEIDMAVLLVRRLLLVVPPESIGVIAL
ncbi:hypothetical protein LPJ66_008755, partial [Kickxella alabastrina]